MAGPSKLRKSGARRAAIVGGSMSGLLAGLLLRRAGWDVEIFERVESELVRPRGRHCGATRSHRDPGPDRHRYRGCRRRDHDAEDPRRRGQAGLRACLSADPHRLGTGLSRIAGCLSARGTITAGAAFAASRRTKRPWPCTLRMDRRSRAISWSAPTACAQPSASNACRTWRRFMPAMSPGARSSRKRRSRQRSIASCSTT